MTGDRVSAEGLRERIAAAVRRELVGLHDDVPASLDVADAVLAALAGDPGDLPARMAAELNAHEWEPGQPKSAHRKHNYRDTCAICQEDLPRIVEVAMSVRWEDHAATLAENAQLRVRAEHAEAELSNRDHRRERWAHERARAEEAEAQVAALQRELTQLRELYVHACRGSSERNSLRRSAQQAERELTEAKRMIDDTLWRMHQLRSWAYRDTTGDVQHNVLAVITNVWDILDPDRTRGPAVDARPDDPEEIRRLAQATESTGEETDG